MKFRTLLSLFFCLSLFIVGCGGEGSAPAPEPEPTEEEYEAQVEEAQGEEEGHDAPEEMNE